MKRDDIIARDGSTFPGKSYTTAVLRPAYDEAKAIADVLQKVRRLSPVLLHRIPLIDADDAPAVTLLDISRNMKVLVGNALRCIEQDNGHMAPVDTA